MKVSIVVVAIGESYILEYNRLFRQSHENYAKKCGYDFNVVTEVLDECASSKRSFSWNKILVCKKEWAKDYDFLIVVDADILINIKSPPIHLCTYFGDKVGIVDEYMQVDAKTQSVVQHILSWGSRASDYYLKAGLEIDTEKMLNTGVLVIQPKKHSKFFLDLFEKYKAEANTHPRGFHYEQAAIGYELQKNNMFIILPKEFNAIWIIQKLINSKFNFSLFKFKQLESYFKKNYFMHLAAHQNFEDVPALQKYNV